MARKYSILEPCHFERRNIVDARKIQAVKDWPVSKLASEIKNFIGLAGYYRRFLQVFSKIAAPVTKLTRKGQKYVWIEEYASAFEQLKIDYSQNRS